MIDAIDHVVLTVADPAAAAAYYQRVLGMQAVTFGNGRRAVRFGDHKINLQTLGDEARNHAATGSGDLCLLTEWQVDRTLDHLKREAVEILQGPVTRSGARGPITSIYFNDPDGNLIEIGRYDSPARNHEALT